MADGVDGAAEEVVGLARRLLDPDESDKRDARSQLIGLVYERVLHGIAWSIRTRHPGEANDPGEVESRLLVDFLEKLCSHGFLAKLVEQPKPMAYISRSAANSVTDHFRKTIGQLKTVGPKDENGREKRAAQEDTGNLDGHLEDVTSDFYKLTRTPISDRWEAIDELGLMGRIFADLDRRDQLLLRVVFSHRMESTRELSRELADLRGVAVSVVEQQLDERRRRINSKFEAMEEDVLGLQYRRLRLEKQIHRVSRVIADLDGEPAEEQADLDPETRQRLSTSTKQLKAATPEQRSAFLDHLQTRERMLAQKRWAILKSLSAGPPPRPDWKEVALIMGAVTAEDEEGAVRRACNTIEVRVKRLRRALYDKLLSAQTAEGSDDA